MNCKICNKPSGEKVTCSKRCGSILKSKRATQNIKAGIGWGRGNMTIKPADKTTPTAPMKF